MNCNIIRRPWATFSTCWHGKQWYLRFPSPVLFSPRSLPFICVTAAPLLIMMESFLVPLLSVSVFHFPVRQRVPLFFRMFLSFLSCAASVPVSLVPIWISHLPVLLFTFLFIQPVVERILLTVSILQLWNQQWNLCEQRGHMHCIYILVWKKQEKTHTTTTKKKSRSQHCSVSLQSLVCCPGRKAILIHTKKHCKAAASKPRCPPGQKLKMSKFLRMMVWAPCVKAWSLGSHCWEVLWTCRRYSPRKGWGDCGPHLFLFLPPLRCYLTWDVGSFAPPYISTTFHCPTTGSKKSPGLKVPILWIKVNLSFYILISLDILL